MLEDLRVLDLSDERGHLAGKILGDLGADVIKIEPPGGDPARARGPYRAGEGPPATGLPFVALNTSKRSVTCSLESQAGRDLFLSLVETTDIVLESAAPGALAAAGLSFEALSERRPGLIQCAITPFGQTGPYADFEAGDLVIVAMGGNAALTGEPDRPPVRCSMPTSVYHAAPTAVFAILSALHARETGVADERGQLVDVSLHECQLATLMTGAGQYASSGRLGERSGDRLGRTREIWPTRDGFVSFGLRGGPTRIPNLIATVDYMKQEGACPAWLEAFDWAKYSPITASDDELAGLEGAFGAFFASKTMSELYAAALERRILLAPCNDAREILAQAQLRDRELFVEVELHGERGSVEHPAFFALSSAGGPRIRSRAPEAGEHNEAIYAELGVSSGALAEFAKQGVV